MQTFKLLSPSFSIIRKTLYPYDSQREIWMSGEGREWAIEKAEGPEWERKAPSHPSVDPTKHSHQVGQLLGNNSRHVFLGLGTDAILIEQSPQLLMRVPSPHVAAIFMVRNLVTE